MVEDKFRIETDSMGSIKVPAWAYWGAQTERARKNFAVSGLCIPSILIYALAVIKYCAAETNQKLNLIPKKIADAIADASRLVMEGKWNRHFPIDVFQTGSGTSWNMNVNEVIANIANQNLGSQLGAKKPVHPNDHVNRGQSSNDVIPAAMNIACRLEAEKLIKALKKLAASLNKKTKEFTDVLKIGRTHLQDAVPMSLGQEFSAYRTKVKKAIERIKKTYASLDELPLGGTAIGTGINAHPDFGPKVVAAIKKQTGLPFKPALNKFEAISARDAQVEMMGALNGLSVSLFKIANDLRLLASGPRTGFGEIILPALQPGSSIMPGKINPVIPEMIVQICAHIMGKNHTVSIGGTSGPLQLNMAQPLIAYETLSSLSLMERAAHIFTDFCINGIKPDRERCSSLIEWSLALVTPLALKIGYDKASQVAHQAYIQKKTVRQVIIEQGLMSQKEVDNLLNPQKMIKPN
jgi:fumarate hydratase class II